MISSCSICKEEFDPAEPFIEGHITSNGIKHAFDPECIRSWLAIRPNCPLCYAPLTDRQLIKIPNPNYSWYKRAIKQLTPSTAQVSFGLKKILPVSVGIGAAYKIIAPSNFISGILSGSTAILVSGIASATPMIFNKFIRRAAIDQKNINKIFLLSIALAGTYVGISPVEELSVTIGTIVGAALSTNMIDVIGKKIIREKGLIQLGLFRDDYVIEGDVLVDINLGAAIIAGGVAAGKLGYYYSGDQGKFIQSISVVAGTALGALSTFLASGSLAIARELNI